MKTTRTSSGHPNKKARGTRPKTEEACGLKKLFIDELKDIYGSEKAQKKAMGSQIKCAITEDLKDLLTEHGDETQKQIARLEKIFSLLGLEPETSKSAAVADLIKEARGFSKAHPVGPLRDAGIIFAAQKMKHHEIATYGTLCSFAQTLGQDEIASLLEDSLNEEKQADETLSQIAESLVNAEAMEPEEQNEK
ncbi:MAG: YciE/YciF ferroxidase family protein [Bacteroidia bacterium]